MLTFLMMMITLQSVRSKSQFAVGAASTNRQVEAGRQRESCVLLLRVAGAEGVVVGCSLLLLDR